MGPKPRPRVRRASPATPALDTAVPTPSSPGPSSAATSIPPQPLVRKDDDDALFLRNQNRTEQEWKALNKRDAEKEKKKKRKAAPSDSDNSDSGSGSSPRSRNKKTKRRGRKQDTLPDWTRRNPTDIMHVRVQMVLWMKTAVVHAIAPDLGMVAYVLIRTRFSDLSDSDDDVLKSMKKTAAIEGKPDAPSKGRCARSRSRSLTPPPALPQLAIMRAREAVNQVVGDVPRAPSPTNLVDDSFDTIVADAELAAVAQRIRSEMLRNGGTPVPEGGGPENVRLTILWRPHPLDPNGQAEVWDKVQKRHEDFHALCAEIADGVSTLEDNVVLMHDGKRVFPSSTPHSIGIWAEAELEACQKATYQYLQENKRMRSESVAPMSLQDLARRSPSHARSPSPLQFSDVGPARAASVSDEDDKPADTFHLVIRSERTKGRDITLLVRPTTKCGAIVRAFLKKAGLDSEYPPNAPVAKGRGRGKAAPAKTPLLSVDGDKMDPETEIGDADLEDGDQVDVVGL
ncbi:hypothetical protein C8Q77DRAFT_1122755 [Trametes polyzona]|nr:hypothetical protein C8Q77DRAFT_1122755 [Trametes polyzona]